MEKAEEIFVCPADFEVIAEVETANLGRQRVRSSIDCLIKNSDGSFSIAMPVFVSTDRYINFLEAIYGKEGVADLSNVKNNLEAYFATSYMYALKRMLENKYPKIQISDLKLVPITGDIIVHNKDGVMKNPNAYESGDRITVNNMAFRLDPREGTDAGVIHIPLEGDSVIVRKPQITFKTSAATPSAQTGNVVSYRDIFARFLDENTLNNESIQALITHLGNQMTEEDIEEYKQDFGDNWKEQVDADSNGMYERIMSLRPVNGAMSTTFHLVLSRKGISDSVIEQLAVAIKAQHDIKGDDGVSLCRI